MAEQELKLEDWLDDLCVRFIINLPREELESAERICFQVEEAQWFYEDFVRPLDPKLPSLNLRNFALLIFQHCPLMSQWSHYHHSAAFSEFLAYKTRVPVRGAILLNERMDEVVLVKGWKKTSGWSFPRGKINKDEKDLDCAIREVYEETGFDIEQSGLIEDPNKVKYIDISMREQNMRLYVIRGVPKDTYFEPRTRKEISKIEWYKLSELPTQRKMKQDDVNGQQPNRNKFYMVAPFLGPLKKWIAAQKKRDHANFATTSSAPQTDVENGAYTTADEGPEMIIDALLHHATIERPLRTDLSRESTDDNASIQLKQLLNISSPNVKLDPDPVHPQTVMSPTTGAELLELLRGGPDIPQRNAPNIPGSSAFQNSAPPSATYPFQSPAPPLNDSAHVPAPIPRPEPAFMQNRTPYPPPPAAFNNQAYLPPLLPGNRFQANPSEQLRTVPQPPPRQIPLNDFPGFRPQFGQNHQSWPAPPNVNNPSAFSPQALANAPHTAQRAAAATYYENLTRPMSKPSTFQAPPVPPASKLPPPTLNSHTLALLNVFKSDHAPTQAAAPRESESLHHDQGHGPDHQDSLLKLLKAGSDSLADGEFKHQLPPQGHIQRDERLHGSGIRESYSSPHPSQIRYIGSNTSQAPHLAAFVPRSASTNPKPAVKATSRPPQRDHSADSHGVQRPSIQILSRPAVASTRQSPVPAPQSSEPSRSPVKRNATISELTKSFKPKILRRPDINNLEDCLPSQTVTVSAFTKPKKETMVNEAKNFDGPSKAPGPNPQLNNASSHQEKLLSLFGKPVPPSSQNTSFRQDGSPHSQLRLPIRANAPVSVESLTSHNRGEATPTALGTATSPVDKALLLGYLDGVVKGTR